MSQKQNRSISRIQKRRQQSRCPLTFIFPGFEDVTYLEVAGNPGNSSAEPRAGIRCSFVKYAKY